MKKLITIPLILLIVSCSSLQKPLCEEPMYLSGKVLLAKYTGKNTRIILYRTSAGEVIIHDVPVEADLNVIPVCISYRDFIYFKKK